MSFLQAHPDFGGGLDDEDYSVTDSGGLIARKQQELSEATNNRCRQLEVLVKQRDSELAYEKNQLKTLTADFEYNLRLLKERDEELEKYEEAMETMKLAVAERDQEAADLRVQLEYSQSKCRSEQEKYTDLEQQHQLLGIQVQSEKETLKQNYESQLRSKTDELRDMTTKIQTQRAELFTETNAKLQEQFSSQSQLLQEQETDMRNREAKLQQTVDSQQQQLNAERQSIQKLEEELRRSKINESRLEDLTREQEHKITQHATGLSDLQETRKTAEEALLNKQREEDATHSKLEKLIREKREIELEFAKVKETSELKRLHISNELDQFKEELRGVKETHKSEIDLIRADCAAEITKVSNGNAAKGHQIEEKNQKVLDQVTEINALKLDYHKLTVEQRAAEQSLFDSREALKRQEEDIRIKNNELKDLSTEVFRLKEEIIIGKEATRIEKDQTALAIEETTTKLQNAQQQLSDLKNTAASHTELERIKEQFASSEAMRRREHSDKEEILKEKNDKITIIERQLLDLTSVRNSHIQNGGHPELSSIANIQQPHTLVPQMELSSGSEYAPVSPLLGMQSSPYPQQHQQVTSPNQNFQKYQNFQMQLDLADQKHQQHTSELQHQISELTHSNQELCRQNSTIRQEVRRFTEEMSSEPIVLKTKALQIEIDDQKRELSSKTREVTLLQSQLMERERETNDLKTSQLSNSTDKVVTRLSSVIMKLEGDLEFHKKKLLMYSALGINGNQPDHADENSDKLRRKYERLKTNTSTVMRENKILKEKMLRAKDDLKRLVTEKNSLLSINNMQLHDIKSLTAQRYGGENLLPSNIIIS